MADYSIHAMMAAHAADRLSKLKDETSIHG
jgi:hypothetical protein